ncbi:hypothetical protein Bcep18194_C7376 [Burkholderia lata]|uniref:Uncharacterized protein n=1 Tax=Burkholderia lata (strain ATCC 17760 / DSM 23089 / LMG 22485 / NCIMB 9086 / R18194 / 383) TaxID=482957 RepID=Q39M96_BURL3|nr:hypothetical protein Bcep18194_C7376 [Burkholderia lata]
MHYPRARYSFAAAIPHHGIAHQSMSHWYRMHRDRTSACDSHDPDRFKEPIPAAPGLVCGHPPEQTFSRAEKYFSGADGIYINTFQSKLRFHR